MIRVQNLSKYYGPRAAIKNLSFEIQKGEIVGFLGPNGAGKTTTMKMLTGFMTPTEGSIEIAGFDVRKNPIEVKKKLGYLPETPPVYSDMTVTAYLRYVADLKLVPKNEKNQNIESTLQSLKLTEVKNRLIQNLSKGYRQRVAIAQALVSNPEVLVLDEPTVGLDPKQVTEFREILKNLKENHTIILSTHILQEVHASCERVIILNQGEIVAQNTIEALTQAVRSKNALAHPDKHVRVFLKVSRPDDSFKSLLESQSYIRSVTLASNQYEIECENQEQFFESIVKNVMKHKIGFQEFRKEQLLLEDVFVKLTQINQQTVRSEEVKQ